MNPDVDDYIVKAQNWRDVMLRLRPILLECGLMEEFKWRQPCYTFQNKNIALIGAIKDSCVLSFLKGSLLKDPKGILEMPGENSQSARFIRFTDAGQVSTKKAILTAYIYEAIEVEKAGLKVDFKAKNELVLPHELLLRFNEDNALKASFNALTPGKQRGYILHISAAKQSKTRSDRIENCREKILKGLGFHDCICGHSKRMPRCDGSHAHVRK